MFTEEQQLEAAAFYFASRNKLHRHVSILSPLCFTRWMHARVGCVRSTQKEETIVHMFLHTGLSFSVKKIMWRLLVVLLAPSLN